LPLHRKLQGTIRVNEPALAAAAHDAPPPRWSGVLCRRAVLQGLGVFLLAGCACLSPRAKSSAVTSASARNDSRPKTVQEFVKQQPVPLPFSDKD
jgi:hypothetical protein